MAYTNNVSLIMADLERLIDAEFGQVVPVYYRGAAAPGDPAWIEVRLLQSEAAAPQTALCSTRRYRFELLVLERDTAEDDLQYQMDRLEIEQRLERLLLDNSRSGNVWFEVALGAVDYQFKPDRGEGQRIIGTRIEWSVTSSEVIS